MHTNISQFNKETSNYNKSFQIIQHKWKDTKKCKNKRAKWTWIPKLLYGVWNQNWKGKKQIVWTSTSANINLEEEQKLKGV